MSSQSPYWHRSTKGEVGNFRFIVFNRADLFEGFLMPEIMAFESGIIFSRPGKLDHIIIHRFCLCIIPVHEITIRCTHISILFQCIRIKSRDFSNRFKETQCSLVIFFAQIAISKIIAGIGRIGFAARR